MSTSPMLSSWQTFIAMGGYSTYVWLAFIVTVLLFVSLFAYILWQRSLLIIQLKRILLRQRVFRCERERRL